MKKQIEELKNIDKEKGNRWKKKKEAMKKRGWEKQNRRNKARGKRRIGEEWKRNK